MIENEKVACNHEDHLGQLQFVTLCWRNLGFEEMNRFVAKETDCASAKSGQFRTRDELIARHRLAELIQRVACHLDPPLDSQFDDLKLVSVGLYHDARIYPGEGEASGHVVFLG
jgi:hypothetical protein